MCIIAALASGIAAGHVEGDFLDLKVFEEGFDDASGAWTAVGQVAFAHVSFFNAGLWKGDGTGGGSKSSRRCSGSIL